MKRQVTYRVGSKTVRREYRHIPMRFIIAVLISLAETLAVIGIVAALCYHIPLFYLAAVLTQTVCIVRIVASDDNPDYKVPWLLVVLVLPLAGFMLYFMFYSRKLKRKFIKRRRLLRERAYRRDDGELLDFLQRQDTVAHAQATMLKSIADAHLFTDTDVRYFASGEQLFPDLVDDLKGAASFIYIESFIIEQGVFWNTILDILKQKAADGVEVKVLYDDIGCMKTLPGHYFKTLQRFGIHALPFSILKGNADSEFNNRNHRKITVIDGKIGYTGGINLADEYINRVERFGYWKDCAVRLEGEAVWELTRLFLEDFGINAKQLPPPRTDWYVTQPPKADRGYLIPFGDGPNPIYPRQVGKSVIQNLLYGAKRYIYMTTPYLIIDNDLCTDIENTALRGVEVRIAVPHIPDKKTVFEITRSYYPRLMAAGVRIFEYLPGFIHAKSYLADDVYAMVGTINLDYRSLAHHFENGVWMYRCPCLEALKQDMEQVFAQSVEITPPMLKVGVWKRLFRALVRVFAPML